MSSLNEKVLEQLDANIPQEEVTTRSGVSGSVLSYLEGWNVIRLLNKIIKQGNWSYVTDTPKMVWTGEVENKFGKKAFSTSYTALVTLTLQVPNKQGGYNTVMFTDIGYGDGQDYSNPGKTHELAVKEAVTDGLKRAAKNLGMRLGLALYDKTQEFVGDVPETQAQPKTAKAGSEPRPGSKSDTLKLISATSRVIVSRGVKNVDELQSIMKTKYGADAKEQLSAAQAKEFLFTLQEINKPVQQEAVR